MVQGIMSFEGFQIDNMSYEKSSGNMNHDYTKLSPEFFIKLAEKENDSSKFNIIMGVRIIDEDGDNSLPFNAEVVVRGFYTLKVEDAEQHEIDDISTFKLVNGCAILFPYVRSALTDITSKSRHNPLILPTINFTRFIENRELDSMILDSSYYEDFNKDYN
ncbi:protein-export chaperone SecB [Heyndrickxia camelliae]|nr:protein-export chaperone SecB [Heyndrickxia camelliae]